MKKSYLMLFIIFLFSISVLSTEKNSPVPYIDGNKCGYSDRNMNIIIKPEYDACGDMIDGMASVMKDGKYGFIDSTGKKIVLPVHTYSSSINKGHAIIGLDNRYAVINSKGDAVIPFTDYYISSYNNGAAVVSENYKYGLMGNGGKIIIPLKYAAMDPAGNSLFIAAEPGKPGSFFSGKNILFNSKGVPVLKESYDLIYPAANGFMKIKNNDKWGYINSEGKIIVPAVYENIRNIKKDGTACFQKNGKWGIINGTGKVILEPSFDGAGGGDSTMEEQLQADTEYFIMSMNGEYGIISRTGEIIAPAKYFMINPGRNGFFTAFRKPDEKDSVSNSLGLTLLNSKGEELFTPKTEYNIVGEEGDGLIPAGKNDPYGNKKFMCYIDHKGDPISLLWGNFDNAWGFSNGFAIVKRDGKYGIINAKGILVENCVYEELTRSANYPDLYEAYISGFKVYLQPGGNHYWKK